MQLFNQTKTQGIVEVRIGAPFSQGVWCAGRCTVRAARWSSITRGRRHWRTSKSTWRYHCCSVPRQPAEWFHCSRWSQPTHPRTVPLRDSSLQYSSIVSGKAVTRNLLRGCFQLSLPSISFSPPFRSFPLFLPPRSGPRHLQERC